MVIAVSGWRRRNRLSAPALRWRYSRGIRVNTVSPGAIGTPIVGRLGVPEEEAEGLFQFFGSKSMAGRVGKATEVGQLVRFLLSDEASYINGAEIPVDGGYLLGKID